MTEAENNGWISLKYKCLPPLQDIKNSYSVVYLKITLKTCSLYTKSIKKDSTLGYPS